MAISTSGIQLGEGPLKGLNRRIYKSRPNDVILGTADTFNYTNQTAQGAGASQTGQGGSQASQPAIAVAPGTIITSAIWQTSNSNDRIQLTPDDTMTSFRNGQVQIQLDSRGLYAYNNNDIVATYDRDGLATYDGSGNVMGLLDGTSFTVYTAGGVPKVVISPAGIEYENFLQPMLSWGEINGSLGIWTLSPGYTLTKNSVGNYTVTHNWGTTTYIAMLTPVSGHFRGRVFNKTANSFDISWQETDYGSVSFPVSGGGGGSVTVSGVKLSEIPVDVTFQLLMVKIPT